MEVREAVKILKRINTKLEQLDLARENVGEGELKGKLEDIKNDLGNITSLQMGEGSTYEEFSDFGENIKLQEIKEVIKGKKNNIVQDGGVISKEVREAIESVLKQYQEVKKEFEKSKDRVDQCIRSAESSSAWESYNKDVLRGQKEGRRKKRDDRAKLASIKYDESVVNASDEIASIDKFEILRQEILQEISDIKALNDEIVGLQGDTENVEMSDNYKRNRRTKIKNANEKIKEFNKNNYGMEILTIAIGNGENDFDKDATNIDSYEGILSAMGITLSASRSEKNEQLKDAIDKLLGGSEFEHLKDDSLSGEQLLKKINEEHARLVAEGEKMKIISSVAKDNIGRQEVEQGESVQSQSLMQQGSIQEVPEEFGFLEEDLEELTEEEEKKYMQIYKQNNIFKRGLNWLGSFLTGRGNKLKREAYRQVKEESKKRQKREKQSRFKTEIARRALENREETPEQIRYSYHNEKFREQVEARKQNSENEPEI